MTEKITLSPYFQKEIAKYDGGIAQATRGRDSMQIINGKIFFNEQLIDAQGNILEMETISYEDLPHDVKQDMGGISGSGSQVYISGGSSELVMSGGIVIYNGKLVVDIKRFPIADIDWLRVAFFAVGFLMLLLWILMNSI